MPMNNNPPPLGVGQSWQDMTASRASGTIYTNTTGRPIVVHVFTASAVAASEVIMNVNGATILDSVFSVSGAIGRSVGVAIVPAGATYSFTSAQAFKCWELR